jgi:hypothetical protein
MSDRPAYSLLAIRELGHGIHDLPRLPRVPTVLGEGDTALTNPPAVDALLAGAQGVTFIALVSRSWVRIARS